jgi:hypothetical protein
MADYNPQQVVGEWGEEGVRVLFDLKVADPQGRGNVPDLASREEAFYVEVKSSAFNNGGVINKGQLYRFDRIVNARRFYAFVFHSVTDNMRETFPTKADLLAALDLRSLYILPFSIVKAHFDGSKKRRTAKHDDFVQLNEAQARAIFDQDRKTWARLNLMLFAQRGLTGGIGEYKAIIPHKKGVRQHRNIHIVTREGHLEKELLASFHPELL